MSQQEQIRIGWIKGCVNKNESTQNLTQLPAAITREGFVQFIWKLMCVFPIFIHDYPQFNRTCMSRTLPVSVISSLVCTISAHMGQKLQDGKKLLEMSQIHPHSKSHPVQTIHPTDLGLLPSWKSMFGALGTRTIMFPFLGRQETCAEKCWNFLKTQEIWIGETAI